MNTFNSNNQMMNTFKSTTNDNYGTYTNDYKNNKKLNPLELSDQQAGATIKGKIQILDDDLNATAAEINQHKQNLNGLRAEKQTLQDTLMLKTNEVKNSLMQELDKVEEELKRHFSHQLAENNRMMQQITSLKCEKTTLLNQLIALQRRITDLEEQVGAEELKQAPPEE